MSPWDGTDDWDSQQWDNYFCSADAMLDEQPQDYDDCTPYAERDDGHVDTVSVDKLVEIGIRVGARDRMELRKAIEEYGDDPREDLRSIGLDDRKAKAWLDRLRSRWLAIHRHCRA